MAKTQSPFGTHMTRTPDDAMSPRFRKGNWLGIIRCWRPKMGRDVIFISERGGMVIGRVVGFSAETWRIKQYHDMSHIMVRRLSRARWRPAWRVVSAWASDEADAYYEAVALGMMERAETIKRALGKLCPMPPPLSSEQLAKIPRIVRMRP